MFDGKGGETHGARISAFLGRISGGKLLRTFVAAVRQACNFDNQSLGRTINENLKRAANEMDLPESALIPVDGVGNCCSPES